MPWLESNGGNYTMYRRFSKSLEVPGTSTDLKFKQASFNALDKDMTFA